MRAYIPICGNCKVEKHQIDLIITQFGNGVVRLFCPPGGTVLDPFLGSGTTAAVAKRLGRHYIGIDVRQSQIDLAQRRIDELD